MLGTKSPHGFMYLMPSSELAAVFGKAVEWVVGGVPLEEVVQEEHPGIL